jgi:hypothetical protein
MIKSVLFLCLLSGILIFSCTGLKPVLKEDFSKNNELLVANPQGEINEIIDGKLHLRGIPDGEAAHVQYNMIYGNNSNTSFKIMFTKVDSSEEPLAMINFLWHEDSRFIIGFNPETIFFLTYINGEETDLHEIPAYLIEYDKWYTVSVNITNYILTFQLENEELIEIELNKNLPYKGYLNFEAHKEFWVDDLEIITEKN